MTKALFEDKFETAFDNATRSSEGGYGPDVTSKWDTFNALYHAVEEFAKEQAIAFSEWNCKNLWSTHGGLWYPYMDEDNPITGEQLYLLFLQSQSTNNKEEVV